jgi:Putative peptidoglycan binding domain
VPERRNNRRGRRAGGSGGAAAAVALRLWTVATYHPVDSTAVLCAAAASLIIIVNAVFLQSGPHPAPFFANPTTLPQLTDNRPTATVTAVPRSSLETRSVETAPPRQAPLSRPQQVPSARRNDPIGDLIGASITPSSRVAAVQRVLSDFGYGQLRVSGILDEPTGAAIQKFEGEHQLPITGRLSNRLLKGLAAMTGHSIE